MSQRPIDNLELAAIIVAANRVAQILGAEDGENKRVVSREVFRIAAETNVFDPDQLFEMASQQLARSLGWRLP